MKLSKLELDWTVLCLISDSFGFIPVDELYDILKEEEIEIPGSNRRTFDLFVSKAFFGKSPIDWEPPDVSAKLQGLVWKPLPKTG